MESPFILDTVPEPVATPFQAPPAQPVAPPFQAPPTPAAVPVGQPFQTSFASTPEDSTDRVDELLRQFRERYGKS